MPVWFQCSCCGQKYYTANTGNSNHICNKCGGKLTNYDNSNHNKEQKSLFKGKISTIKGVNKKPQKKKI